MGGTLLTFTPLGRCPFCGGKVAADMGNCVLSHELPACQRFEQLEVTEFLAQMRAQKEGRLAKA